MRRGVLQPRKCAEACPACAHHVSRPAQLGALLLLKDCTTLLQFGRGCKLHCNCLLPLLLHQFGCGGRGALLRESGGVAPSKSSLEGPKLGLRKPGVLG